MPWIAILLAVCDSCGGHPPRPHAIGRWQERYLRLFDQDADSWRDPESASDRRNVILATFSRLRQLSLELYGGHADDDVPAAGATYIFPLDAGRLSACRVLARVIDGDDELYGAPMVVVATAEWVGRAAPRLDDPLLRSIHRVGRPTPKKGPGVAEPAIGWLSTPPPSAFRYVGLLPPTESESRLRPLVFYRDWEVLPEQRAHQLHSADGGGHDEAGRMPSA